MHDVNSFLKYNFKVCFVLAVFPDALEAVLKNEITIIYFNLIYCYMGLYFSYYLLFLIMLLT